MIRLNRSPTGFFPGAGLALAESDSAARAFLRSGWTWSTTASGEAFRLDEAGAVMVVTVVVMVVAGTEE